MQPGDEEEGGAVSFDNLVGVFDSELGSKLFIVAIDELENGDEYTHRNEDEPDTFRPLGHEEESANYECDDGAESGD